MNKPIKHHRKWRIRWTDATGKRQSQVFDSYKDAEYTLRQKEFEAEQVRRGFRSLEVPNKTFLDLVQYWEQFKIPQKRSGNDDQSILKAHLKPFFGALPLKEMCMSHVTQFQLSRKHLSPKTVHNHLTLLISMLNSAYEMNWIVKVPKIRKPKIKTATTDYAYLKTDFEIECLLQAAKNNSPQCYALYAAALYTGMRQGELAGLTWEDVDFKSRLIYVKRSFNGPTKSGESRIIPLLDILFPILWEWRGSQTCPLVFPNERGNMHAPSARIFQEMFQKILTRAGFKISDLPGSRRKKGAIVFHDLRHTFASHWMMKGGDLFKLQKILGHQSIAMTMRYAHLSPTAFSEDLNLFSKRLVEKAEPKGGFQGHENLIQIKEESNDLIHKIVIN